ncbi:MAG: ABC transporter ATP-binding protein [Roseburia sp.]|uniref:ABC transporter ATP-binding protein n=1 Tax=Roseburia sp. 831b TaxID=1261635 RepID=UPI000951D6B0|nr:ABC transporter ATP-binding protein [Roseburia sp. 831b]MDD6217375.1 ABC transporter ATP-binding protein [Roseburia sp.]WVK72974.1 ABC transporter ATP-binding protein [Roseburia sp. 831b]
MEPIIEFKDYSFKYRSQVEPTLQDINLSIYPGEKVLIVGPSGSGKSTLAHCINGLVPFSFTGESKGSLKIKGQDPAKLGIFGMSKLVGTVLQDTDGQFIGLTVAEDIAFSMENDCIEQEEMFDHVNRVAKTVDITDFLDHAPNALSGGQKQRVSMAGVIVDDVDILLFDEPLANLDPATGKRAIDLIDRIHKEKNTTIVIIEHRLEDVLYRDVDRIIVVGDGRIVSDLKPDELLAGQILKEQGIREPLYITALKYAGCTIKGADLPQHIESMNLLPYKERVQNWYGKVQLTKKTSDREPALEVRNLSFSYVPGQPVLSHIDFSIAKGEMVALVGKNGAGKSTLASLICGFMQPDEGGIYLNGEDLSGYSIKERGEKIGLVMQSPNQMISKPMIFDEVALGLRVRGVPEEEVKERVFETLKICGLYPFRNWPVSALSFGQKKRVTIASILVMNPEILILDEPTAGQDYHHYTEIMEFLRKIHRELGITIVMITHDMHLMLEYTDRAIVIADGQMLADDTPANILTNEEISDRAYLKKTSLYDLAVRCDIDEPSAFVECFIQYEREVGRDV